MSENNNPVNQQPGNSPLVTRREMLASTAGISAFATSSSSHAAEKEQDKIPDDNYRIVNNRIHQSVMGWCFNPMPTEELIAGCAKMGLPAMEGINPKYYPLLKKHGLKVSLVSSHGYKTGPVDTNNYEFCDKTLRNCIDLAVEYNCANVITFTGMRVKGMSDKQATKNCVEFWKSVVGYAEEKNVNLALEHLNTRDDSHPMKGHPGYFGDDLEQCVDMIRQVDSPRMKLLFDIYHVQVMNGDVIRRFRQHKDLISHVHTAGCPGRGEIDETQELNYPAIMRAILESGYQGYVAQEFIPNWKDKLAALRHGVATCDV